MNFKRSLSAIAISVGSCSFMLYAESTIVDGLKYKLDADDHTAVVTYISDEAGFLYPDLKGEVRIPETIKAGDVEYTVVGIGSRAFEGCENITSFVLPEKITEIGNQAFLECIKLTEINIPSGVRRIGQGAFSSTAITSMILPEGITEIPEYAFYGTCLDVIAIPSTVVKIGENAFARIQSLKSVTFNEGLVEIEASAFNDCKSLMDIKIPSSVKEIGKKAFFGCKSLTSADLNSVEILGESCFENCISLTDLELGKSMKEIGCSCFGYCGALKSVVIPASVVELGQYSFIDCLGLERVVLSDGSSPLTLGVSPFANDLYSDLYLGRNLEGRTTRGLDFRKISRIVIGDSVTELPLRIFSKLPELKEVVFGKGLKEVGSGAFEECPLLKKVVCNDIESWAKIDFEDYTSNPLYYGADLFDSKGLVTDLTFTTGLTEIGDNSFVGYDKITSLKLPDSVVEIGDDAFAGCSALSVVKWGRNISTVGGRAFKDCVDLKRVDCEDLSAWIKTDFENIYSNPLASAGKLYVNGELLEELQVPEDIVRTGKHCFSHYVYLKSVSLPESCVEIGDYSFMNCKVLENVSWCDGMRQIGKKAFNGAPLKSITSKTAVPPVISTYPTTSSFTYYEASVYVPAASVETYRNDSSWKNFNNITGKDFSYVDELFDNEAFYITGRKVMATGRICIFTADGMKVAEMTTGDNLQLKNGVYLIVADGITSKILIR